ncbi:hypothetical protein [Dyella japonica]|jgi:hypothetical protein|uniref:Uncharacterized protein n=1 Tax=Dyella japonica DSM 16301 TaxID=1440762 RepID=A0A0G9H797_9GAMM|nr:hypothetical protein [Dyella japonica]KLD65483.1 hypothetical protein Y882_02960 [Dyella japonica DSM 16301]
MQRKTLLASALALMVAGAASLVVAQDAPTPPPAKGSAKAAPMAHDAMPGPMGGPDGGFGHPGFGRPDMAGPESPVIGDLAALERLYRESGRSKELPALYNDVLSKSQDPRVRTYVYHQLARLQAAPANPDQAIATLRKSLDENLANAAKMRADMDKLRSQWEQRSNQPKS